MKHFFMLDSSTPWQMYFQDAATPVMEGIMNLHHDLMFFMTFIFFFVLVVMASTLYYFVRTEENMDSPNSLVVHGTTMEIIWTVVPSLILIVVALPSFALLYSIDEMIDPALTLKCIGNQWYWTYEYSDFENQSCAVRFDSYIVPEDDLEFGTLRLLEVDNRVVLPLRTHISLLMTASDVLHSWAVPSLGVKLDACPGRLNQTSLFMVRNGIFFGQCSEMCGSAHALMPIAVESVDPDKFLLWLNSKV